MQAFQIGLVIATILSLANTSVAQSSPPPVIEGILDFSNSSGEDDAADMFFESVGQHVGEIVQLKLRIVPGTADSKGYSLDVMQPEAAGAGEATEIVCGEGLYGFVDNLNVAYRLTFNHTQLFHNPTTVVIGPRMQFPHQSARCSAEGAGEGGLTALEVSGFYVVDQTTIPTANDSLLIPVNP